MSGDITRGPAARALLEELRLLRQMGEAGRIAGAKALRAARQASEHPDVRSIGDDADLKVLIHELDTAIVQRGGRSIFAAKPVGELSPEAEQRLQVWACETPRRHANTPGVVPNDRPTIAKPGRLVATLTGKLGGYVSDLEDER